MYYDCFCEVGDDGKVIPPAPPPALQVVPDPSQRVKTEER
jgi:hypothetical protein